MAQSLAQMYVHIVFSTKERYPMIQEDIETQLYAAFSVSSSRVEAVKRYIAGQKEHHRTVTFKEELLEFLQRYNIEYDERYLWD